MFVHTEPRPSIPTLSGSANQNSHLFTLSLEGPCSAPAILAARAILHRHFPVSLFHFPASLSPFRPLPLRASKSRRINTYEILRKCCNQRTYRIAKSFRFHRVEKPWVANQGVLKSKELTSALPCLTLSDFHEISRAALGRKTLRRKSSSAEIKGLNVISSALSDVDRFS